MDTTLRCWGSWPQVDGGTRYALDVPALACEHLAALRADAAMADALRPAVLVEREPDGRLVALEWPGRQDGQRPPWEAIREAIH